MKRLTSFVVAAFCICAACTAPSDAGGDNAAGAEPQPALRLLADFPIGVAVPIDPYPNSLLQSPERQALVNRHFDSLTAENGMKMVWLRPAPGEFAFDRADAMVNYAQRHDMLVHGHALVWHKQAPAWMNEFEGTRDDFIAVLAEHVRTVAGHFAGRLESWDVVNEAFTDDVPSQYRNTIWYDNIGPEYIELTFRLANEADPRADLYYNDYGIAGTPDKLSRVLEMVDDFQARGVPIDGVGFQMHINTQSPKLDEIRDAFAEVVERGIKVRVSELDVSVNIDAEYTEFNPELAALQRQRYADVARIYREAVPSQLRGGITVWGITDADSWIPAFRSRPDWPLLFDADFRAKPALQGMVDGITHPVK